MPSDLNMCLNVPKSPVLYTRALPPAPSTCILLLTRSKGYVATKLRVSKSLSSDVYYKMQICMSLGIKLESRNYNEEKVRSNSKPVEETAPARPPEPRLTSNFESSGLKRFKENSKI